MKQKEILFVIVGSLVRAKREELGVSQTVLAESLKIKRTSLVNIEGGKQRIQLTTLYQIALALDCDVIDLLPKTCEKMLADSDTLYREFLISLS